MRKSCVFLLIITLCSSLSFAQSKKSVSILGDSYSTFEGYLQPDTNSIWYYTIPRHKTDVVSVRQTWWHQFIKENIASIVDQNSGVFTLNCDILQCKTFHICHPYQFIGLSHQVFYQTILCRSFGDTIQINKQQ